MKFLANENYPKPSIVFLRNKGFEVKSIQEGYGGIPDEEVIAIAEQEGRIILTFDSDYGELLFKYQRATPPSVVYFRFKGRSPSESGRMLFELLNANLEIEGYFTVIEETGVRQRKLSG
jgi:predicted nuclease of predicted toxin-antitoxin system